VVSMLRRPRDGATRLLPGEVALADLRVRLGPVVRRVAWAVDDAADHGRLLASDRPGTVTRQHASLLLARAQRPAAQRDRGPTLDLLPSEVDQLTRLAEEAALAGLTTPWETLRSRGLDDVDLGVLLVTAAPLAEPALGGLYAYLQESFDATLPGERLAVRLLAVRPGDERRVTEAAGPFGRLRSWGLVETAADRLAGPLLRPAPGVAELLHGSPVDLGLLGVPGAPQPVSPLPPGVDGDELDLLARAFMAGAVDVVGVWGVQARGADAVVDALCGGPATRGAPVRVGVGAVASGLQQAALAGVPCIVDAGSQASSSPEEESPSGEETLLDLLARSSTRCVVVAPEPLPLPRLWGRRRVAEIALGRPVGDDQRRAWATAFPALPDERVDDLATRFALTADQVLAVAAQDDAVGAWADGHRPSIDQLATRLSRPRSPRLASLVVPRRGRDLLVLPAGPESRVLRVADDFRAWPAVSSAWRLDRFGGRGVTALFAGPPGTGKTLAAEVVAGEVGLDLMVVDLSLLVSKWVGETEKNLDTVFTEAESARCVLFFDEADTVFGKRGEIDRGTDRYANLEVGYLLQRLERYDGLVVLATNVSEQLDDAFTRRFHHVVHFARPGPTERRRLWELVLAPPVVLDGPVDLDRLTELDLTGAGVASVVRSAALAAHHDGRGSVRMGDLVRAVARTLQREGRLLPRDLSATYAAELVEVS
jgi:hypothetical protein